MLCSVDVGRVVQHRTVLGFAGELEKPVVGGVGARNGDGFLESEAEFLGSETGEFVYRHFVSVPTVDVVVDDADDVAGEDSQFPVFFECFAFR